MIGVSSHFFFGGGVISGCSSKEWGRPEFLGVGKSGPEFLWCANEGATFFRECKGG